MRALAISAQWGGHAYCEYMPFFIFVAVAATYEHQFQPVLYSVNKL